MRRKILTYWLSVCTTTRLPRPETPGGDIDAAWEDVNESGSETLRGR